MTNKIHFRHISEYQSPEQSPGYLLWRVSIRWRNVIEKTLRQYDLTHPQFVVLASLAWLTKDGKKVSQIDVGRVAGLDSNTTSQIFRGLEKKDMIERTQSVDERSKNPILTLLGSKTLAKAMPAVEKSDNAFFALLKVDEKNTLIQCFNKFITIEKLN